MLKQNFHATEEHLFRNVSAYKGFPTTEGAGCLSPEIWQGKLTLPLRTGWQHSRPLLVSQVSILMFELLPLWELTCNSGVVRSCSITKRKTKKGQLKTEKRKTW